MNLDSDPQDMIMMGIFENKDVYHTNADDPDQDAWLQRLMGDLESEPQWHDGEFIATWVFRLPAVTPAAWARWAAQTPRCL
ncbi:MAG: hypothetical protein QGI88_05775 [SAR202 cluster bacterium]|nr:hypothetical protein [SAR202 cluster bacterium]MDP7533262.1 hypothetical protein [SAR202 cluster bacterium]